MDKDATLYMSVESARDAIKEHISDFGEIKNVMRESIAETYNQEKLIHNEEVSIELMACAYIGALKSIMHLMDLMLGEVEE